MNRSVLVVEDDADLASLLQMILTDGGYEVALAGDGLQALARLEERMPGVILLDMRMPVMNGWEFAREYQTRYGREAGWRSRSRSTMCCGWWRASSTPIAPAPTRTDRQPFRPANLRPRGAALTAGAAPWRPTRSTPLNDT